MTTTTTRRSTRAATSPAQRAELVAREARLVALHAQIDAGVPALAASDAWRAMLDTGPNHASDAIGQVPGNQLLVATQCPDATRVSGFSIWKALGRVVCKEERGIAIPAPCPTRTRAPGTRHQHRCRDRRGHRPAGQHRGRGSGPRDRYGLWRELPHHLDGPVPLVEYSAPVLSYQAPASPSHCRTTVLRRLPMAT